MNEPIHRVSVGGAQRRLRRHSQRVCLAAAVLVLAVGALNAAFDPLGTRCTEAPARPSGLERTLRVHQPACQKPDALLLGTSRTTFGMRAPDFAAGAYNLGIAGGTTYEIRRYFQHANGLRPTRQALLLLDFYSVTQIAPVMQGFREAALSVAADGSPQPLGPALDRFGVTFSGVTLRRLLHMGASWLRGVPTGVSYSRQGDGLDQGRVGLSRTVGDRAAFLRGEQGYRQSRWMAFMQLSVADRQRQVALRLDDLAIMLKLACAQRTAFTIAVSPAHAWHWQGMVESGVWPEQQAFLRQLVQLRDDTAREGACEPAPLWDFSGADGVTAEAVPAAAGQPLRYWLDAGHFKPEVGRLVLAALRGGADLPLPVARLERDHLDAHFAARNENLRRWAAAHPADVQALQSLGVTASQPALPEPFQN